MKKHLFIAAILTMFLGCSTLAHALGSADPAAAPAGEEEREKPENNNAITTGNTAIDSLLAGQPSSSTSSSSGSGQSSSDLMSMMPMMMMMMQPMMQMMQPLMQSMTSMLGGSGSGGSGGMLESLLSPLTSLLGGSSGSNPLTSLLSPITSLLGGGSGTGTGTSTGTGSDLSSLLGGNQPSYEVPSALQQKLDDLQEQQRAQVEALGDTGSSSSALVSQSDTAPTNASAGAVYHDPSHDSKGDRRISCGFSVGGGSSVAGCRGQ